MSFRVIGMFYHTMIFPEQTVSAILQGHVNSFQNCFEMENSKTFAFISYGREGSRAPYDHSQ
jgi:hypothetical protein